MHPSVRHFQISVQHVPVKPHKPTIPKKFRDVLGLQKGDLAEAELEGERIVIIPKKQVEDKALQELIELLDRVHERNKGFSEKEVTADVLRAIAELREEEYAKQKKT